MPCMFTPRDKYSTRQKLLAPVMVGILAVSVGAAWLLAHVRQGRVDAAEEVLATLRSRGLRAIWGDRPWRAYFVGRTQEGEPVGWLAMIRKPTDSGYVGTFEMHRAGDGYRMNASSRWELDNGARNGRYFAVQRVTDPRTRMSREFETSIELSPARLEIIESGPRGAAEASLRPPENYLPEGAMSAVVRLMRDAPDRTGFQQLLDTQAIRYGKAYFATVLFDAAQGDAVEVVTHSMGETGTQVYRLDDTGEVRGIEDPEGVSYQAASLEKVLKLFPDSHRRLERTAATREAERSPKRLLRDVLRRLLLRS